MDKTTSWNDAWFKDATKEEVKELYGDKGYLLNQALEHWKLMNPHQKKKAEPTNATDK